MTTSTLDRVPVDAITEHAKQVRPGRTLLTLVAGVLFGLGWVTAKAFAVVWLGFTWSWAAVSVGWTAAHGPSRSARLAAQAAEIESLRASLSRFSG